MLQGVSVQAELDWQLMPLVGSVGSLLKLFELFLHTDRIHLFDYLLELLLVEEERGCESV